MTGEPDPMADNSSERQTYFTRVRDRFSKKLKNIWKKIKVVI
jgi:hypothetical protein